MIKSDIRNSIQYKYIKYRFKSTYLKNETLQHLSKDEKEKILIKADYFILKDFLASEELYFYEPENTMEILNMQK